MTAVTAILQARMGSTRLPGKVMMELGHAALYEVLIRRLEHAHRVTQIVLATTSSARDDVLAGHAVGMGFRVHRGPEEDVLGRYIEVADRFGGDIIVRVTCDNPLTDADYVDASVEALEAGRNDYVCFEGLPFGVAPEVMTRASLERAGREGRLARHREHVTVYIKEHPQLFRLSYPPCRPPHRRPRYRLSVDEPEDLHLLRSIFAELVPEDPAGPTLDEVIRLLDRRPDLVASNRHVRQKPVV